MTPDLFERDQPMPTWLEVNKGHRALVSLADRHYTRQKPGSKLCTRPGVNLCLLSPTGRAGWIVWRPIPEVGRKDGLEAWECTLSRNEDRDALSSDLIRLAAALTFRRWGWPPRDGLITAVGIAQTVSRRSRRAAPGQCFRVAGWTEFDHPFPDPTKVWLRAPHPQRIALEAA